jgi:hypothetical protein
MVAWKTVSATGDREQRRGLDCVRRQETLLAVTWQVGDSSYSDTGEAVRTLKRPIRGGIDNGVIRSQRCISPS